MTQPDAPAALVARLRELADEAEVALNCLDDLQARKWPLSVNPERWITDTKAPLLALIATARALAALGVPPQEKDDRRKRAEQWLKHHDRQGGSNGEVASFAEALRGLLELLDGRAALGVPPPETVLDRDFAELIASEPEDEHLSEAVILSRFLRVVANGAQYSGEPERVRRFNRAADLLAALGASSPPPPAQKE